MRKVTTILLAAAASAAFALPALAASPGIFRSPAVQPNPETIAELEQASAQAQRDALEGNKDNLEFRRKSYEIDRLIARMESGQPVGRMQVDQALAPTWVW